MTTVAYAAVTQSGLSFDRQLWMRPEIIPGLRRLTDAIHAEGAAAGIQLGHCGNMSHKSICGCMPVGASSGFNLYSPTFVRGLRADELPEMARAYGRSVNLAREAGFDSVEIHAGHGYLISQFLSPSTNHRKDEFGGSLQNRMRFMDMVMEEVMKAAGSDMAVLVKMNMRDGFRGGMELDETMQVARRLEQSGAHALVLSGGFVSKAPMYVMRGEMPIRSMTHYMTCWWLKYGVRMVGKWMIPSVPFKEAYFLEDALKFRAALKIPLVYVGGLVSRDKIDEVLDDGFELVQRLIELGLQGVPLGHLLVQFLHFPGAGRRERSHPPVQQRLLPILVRRALFKAGDIPRKGLPQVMDDTHANDLVHVGFREFLLQEKGHQGHHPAVFGHALPPAVGSVAVAGGPLQPFCHGQGVQQGSWFHPVSSPISSPAAPAGRGNVQ